MASNVIVFQNGIKSPAAVALGTQLEQLVDDHISHGQLSIAELIGVLECLKLNYWQRLMGEEDE